MIQPPAPLEHPPYYGRYIELVPASPAFFDILAAQPGSLQSLLAGVRESQAETRPAPGEWSIKEVLGHLNDTERIFAFRALWMARADAQPLPGFEQDGFVRATDFNRRPLTGLIEEFSAQRASNVLCFQPLSDDELVRTGTASGGQFTVRALLYMLAGHVLHHMESLRVDYGVGRSD
jgi:hypothetical protein